VWARHKGQVTHLCYLILVSGRAILQLAAWDRNAGFGGAASRRHYQFEGGHFRERNIFRAKVVARSGGARRMRMEFMEKMRPFTLLLLRIGVGVVFMDNGYPKFWGRRLEHIDEFVHVAHLPAYFVYIAGALELGGGALLVAGLFTRILGLLLAGEMAVALWRDEKIFQHPLALDTYGLALVLGVGAFALATFGAGSFSLDRVFFGKGKSARGVKS
jgi:putative oxidoreductase